MEKNDSNYNNVFLYSQLRELIKRNTQLQIINQIAKSITLEMTFDEMIEDVAVKLQRIISFDLMNLCILENGNLIVHRELPKGISVIKEGTLLEQETSWAWEVIRKRRFSIRTDIQNDGQAFTRALKLFGLKSIIIVPLIARTGIIGTLNLGSKNIGEYIIDDASFLQQVADQLALLFEDARLYQEEILLRKQWEDSYKMATSLMEEMEKRNLQLEIINNIAKNISVETSLEEIAGSIAELKKVVAYDLLNLCFLEKENSISNTVIEGTETQEQCISMCFVFDRIHSGPARVMSEKRMIVRPNISEDPYSFPEDIVLAHLNIKSQIILPLFVKGESIGALILGSHEPFTYKEEEIVFLRQVADQLSLCIENVRLYSEESLSKRAWEETFKAVTDMLIVINRKGKIVRFNKAVLELGKERQILPQVGQLWYEYFDPEQYDHVQSLLKEAVEKEQSANKRIHLPSGVVWDLSSFPILNKNSHVDEVVISIREVTERVNMEAQLIQSAKLAAVGEIASGIAHELNSPLTAIIGNTLLLERDAKIYPPEKGKLLDNIKKCGERCKNIILKLRAFVRQEKYSFESINMNDIVEGALALVSYEIEKNNTRIVKNFAGELPVVIGSSQHLEQVLVNLLINARDALRDCDVRDIYLTTGIEEQFVYIEVRDTGCGIEYGHLKQIFSPFFTTKVMGTGLGLSISQNIAQAHGGKLVVQSEIGQGSKFSLLIPIEEPEQQ
ncbi:MAG: GAF domain-containing protein [Desulfotomaculaceae bacterium]|nr:GAF domain-containing protein [Desulfotomaculaceae bacterium]